MSLSCHVRIFESSHILYFFKCQEHIGPDMSDISNLSECNGSGTHNHLVFKKTRNYLDKRTK